jgi:MFS transporter, DHA1 family, multidrug resistance protein
MSSPTQDRMPSHGWLVLLLGALSALVPLSIDMYLPAFPQIAADLGVEVGEVQLTLSIYMVGMAIGQAMYGALADRLGRRGPLLFGVAVFAIATAGCAMAGSIHALMAWRLAVALGGSAGMVITRAVVRDRFDATESSHIYSMLMLVMGVAPILAPILGGQLLLLGGWRVIFAVIATFGALCVLAVWKYLPETLPVHERVRHGPAEILQTYWTLLLNRTFLGYVLGVSFASGVLFAYISGSPTLFIEEYGISAQKFGLFFGANAAGLILTAQLNRWLLRRFTPRSILRTVYLLNLVFALLLLGQVSTGWGGFPAVVVILWVCVASTGLIFPNSTALAMAPVGRAAGSASALMGTLQFGVGGTVATLVGLLHTGTAIPMAVIIAGCSATGYLLLRVMTRSADA